MHDTATNTGRITFTTAGVYAIVGNVRFAAHATGRRAVSIRLNGTTVIARVVVPTNSGTYDTTVAVSTQYKFAATDYVELLAIQDSGGALNVEAVANISPEFMAAKVATG